MSKEPKRPLEKKDLVITPGGPRAKDQVHALKPGEVLRRNKDGSYTIVPTARPSQN
jgi:hypothetical protein